MDKVIPVIGCDFRIRVHESPDYDLLRYLTEKMFFLKKQPTESLYSMRIISEIELWHDYEQACRLFCVPRLDDDEKCASIEAINKIAPGAYAYGKKPSRIFKCICDAIGVTGNTKGSDFQRLYARLADELCVKEK